jgi:hypothetical protein
VIGMTVAWHSSGFYEVSTWITLIGTVVGVSADLGHALVLAPDRTFAILKTSELFAPTKAEQTREIRNQRKRERRQAAKRARAR